mmetsp:Transcript_20911/g.46445  ORF Transcript_20911/g.46445 Transcript_20911/m.46445 type:complete len:878 (-) Transcript_20911:59-2692(-)
MKTQVHTTMRTLVALALLSKATAVDLVTSATSALTQAPDNSLDLEGQLLNMISASSGMDLNFAPVTNATVLDKDIDQLATGLAKLRYKGQGKATPEFAGFVKTVNGMINDDMVPKVKKAHTTDVTTMAVLDNAFSLCKGKKVSSDSRIKNLITKSGKTTTAHRSCRTTEGRWYDLKTTCSAEVALLLKIKKTECQKQRLMWRNPNTEAAYCHTTKRPEPYKLWLNRNRMWFEKKEKAYLAQKKRCDVATDNHKKAKPPCDRKIATWKSTRVNCNNLQNTLEGDTCSAGRQHQASCKEYRKCYSDALRAKYAQMPVIKKNEKDRKTEWRGLKRISCLLNVFATDESEPSVEVIDKCKQKTHDTTILNIAYKKAPARQRCGASPTVPCSTSFHRTYYWRLPSRGQPKRCEPCAIKTSGFGTDPTYWLTAENFLPKQNVWINKGTGPNIQNVVTSGKAHMELISGDGAISPLVAMTGGTSTTLRFGRVVPRQYTICSLTKYTGNRYRGRILQGAGVNWLHGHWASRKGVAYYNGWKTQHSARRSLTRNNDWSAVCGKSYGRAPYNLLVDGKPQGIATTNNQYPHGGLYVNGGAFGNEKSAFAIGDIMIWDTPLSNFHMKKAMDYLLGKLQQKISARELNSRKMTVKQEIRPVVWLTAEGFKPQENKWINKGSGKTIRNVVRGKKAIMALRSGFGARADILSVEGGIDTALNFGVVAPREEYTLCALTRYTGNQRHRILTAKNNNVLFGHWSDKTGVVYMDGWKTDTNTKGGKFNWLPICVTNRGAAGPNVVANGKEIGEWPHGPRPWRDLVINDKTGLWKGERSDFAVAEIKVWDQQLTKYAMRDEMAKLTKKLSTPTSAVERLRLKKIEIAANTPDKKE